MDYELTPDQQALLDAVDSLLTRHAGPARARAMRDRHDDGLLTALDGAGFLDLARDRDAGPLEAALVTEASARALAAAHVGARALVAPQVLDEVLDAPVPSRIALADAARPGPVRFGGDADVVLVLDGADVRIVEPVPGSVEPVSTGYVLPYARIDLAGGLRISGAGPEMATWWRIAIAAELAGLLAAALTMTSDYLAQRNQFGRPLGSLQALQHRLAESYVWVEGTRWSARSAAWHGGPEAAATAVTYAAMAARHVAVDMHQLSGAIGFTEEYDLHLWTMRAQALRTELGGIGGHATAVTSLRWAG